MPTDRHPWLSSIIAGYLIDSGILVGEEGTAMGKAPYLAIIIMLGAVGQG